MTTMTAAAATPFVNEPFTDFSQEENAAAFRAALERVKGQLGQSYPNVIGGERFELDATLSSTNPADPSQVIGTFPAGESAESERAVAAAEAAFDGWSRTSWKERADILFRLTDHLRENKHDYSAWMVYEVGKSWAEADGDTAEAIDFCDYYARQALRCGEGLEVVQTADHNEAFYIPLGVGAVIAPWNFPLAILCGMTAAAIVTGNTVVIKPAEESPTIGYKLMEAFEGAGVPPGVINFLTGDGEKVGAPLVQHTAVRFVSFTGSKAVGLWINEAASARVDGQRGIKRVVAEMGGKDAIIVDRDANLDEAAAGIVAAAYGFQGQKCSACSRAIVHDEVYDAVVDKAVALAKDLRMGDPENLDTPYGPVISEEAYDKTRSYQTIGAEEGTVVLGGGVPDRAGWFIDPTIVRDISEDSRLAQEEVFGPVLAFIRARDWEHALTIANGTPYGLTGGVYSGSDEHLEDAKRRFHVGNLYLNRKCTGALVGAQPFGGFNMSGTCSKAGGPDYLGLFVQAKSVATKR